jgi:hypothetical protein
MVTDFGIPLSLLTTPNITWLPYKKRAFNFNSTPIMTKRMNKRLIIDTGSWGIIA